jgi:integrase
MSIFKREGSSRYQFDFVKNKKRYWGSTGCTDKQAAITWVSAYRTQLAHSRVGINPIRNDRVEDLLKVLQDRWRGEGKLSVQNSSLLKHTGLLWGKHIAQDITVLDLERFVQSRTKQGYSLAASNRIIQALRRAFKVSGIDWPKYSLSREENVREGIASSDQVQTLLEELPDDGLRDYICFLHATGMRKGQAREIRWSHLQNDVFVIPGKHVKSRRLHKIPINESPLAEIIERRKAARSFTSGEGATVLSDYVFHRGDGLPIKEFRKAWRSAIKRANLSGLLVHDLRRAAISDMVRAGIAVPTAMKVSGHKTIATFLRYSIGDVKDVAEALKKTAEFRKRVS